METCLWQLKLTSPAIIITKSYHVNRKTACLWSAPNTEKPRSQTVSKMTVEGFWSVCHQCFCLPQVTKTCAAYRIAPTFYSLVVLLFIIPSIMLLFINIINANTHTHTHIPLSYVVSCLGSRTAKHLEYKYFKQMNTLYRRQCCAAQKQPSC